MVYPYTDDRRMVSALASYTSSGLAENGSVVLITTDDDHRYAITRHISGDVNVEVFERNGQLVFLDASELGSCMVGGNPDPKLFTAGIKKLFERAGHHPYTGRKREVLFFGETISLLWPTNTAAAERIEQLGNEIVEVYSVPIL